MKKKLIYMLFVAGLAWGAVACEDKDFEGIVSATDDYVEETGGDYYEGEGIDVSLYSRARIFPGLVDTLTEERKAEVMFPVEMSRLSVDASSVNLKITPSPIYSTGLYAGAGEKVTIVLDDDIKGLTAQIGIHTTDLSDLSGNTYLERDPKVTTMVPLFKGINELRNPYGGYLWIKRSGNGEADGQTVTLRIQNVYEAPDFVLDETEPGEWMEKIKKTTVPWIELRGTNIAFSVPLNLLKLKVESEGIAFVNKMKEALDLWDDWVECYNQFYGLDGADSNFPKLGFPLRAVMDVHLITERYSYYNNTNIELLSSQEMFDVITDPERVKSGDEYTVHVIGWLFLEMYEQSYVPSGENTPNSFSTIYKVLPNFYFLYKNKWMSGANKQVPSYKVTGWGASYVMNFSSIYVMEEAGFDEAIRFASQDSCKVYNPDAKMKMSEIPTKNDPAFSQALFALFSSIIGYEQQEADASGTKKDGWKFFGYFNRFLAEESQKSVVNRLSMTDALLTALTEYFDRDFMPVFDRWGLTVSDDVKNKSIEKAHLEKQIWKYNPLAYNEVDDYDGKVFYTHSGKTPFLHVRKGWEAAAYSGEGDGLKSGNYKYLDENKTFSPAAKDGTPFNLFDGDISTMWISYHDDYKSYKTDDGEEHFPYKKDSLYYKATTPRFPYTVVIKPGTASLDIDGVYFGFGDSKEEGIYNKDWKNYDNFTFTPKHVIVEVTSASLEYNDVDSVFVNYPQMETSGWTTIYDSDRDLEYVGQKQYWPDRKNLFYIDLPSTISGVRGIRLRFDRVSHVAKDRPAGFPVEEKPNRPEKANKELDRIQKIAEFGTYYY
ncbi:M60 family peptidase N-terminal accessory domain-containing protein [uncultured Bacteroides sp.]|uniref:M60 family peptidase N-terminal accessory domain-containing protein n=1 Tax=uncultured Bacteroides sp. TaxID=162156 RepID=UPI0026769158|nr:M60 family peptidase N-terminal accessory domain-containing protein [uncultured Bacteroides sp.]